MLSVKKSWRQGVAPLQHLQQQLVAMVQLVGLAVQQVQQEGARSQAQLEVRQQKQSTALVLRAAGAAFNADSNSRQYCDLSAMYRGMRTRCCMLTVC